MESEQLYHRGYCRNSYNSIASASSDEELLDGAGVIMDFHTTEDDNLLDGDAASPGRDYRKYRISDSSSTFYHHYPDPDKPQPSLSVQRASPSGQTMLICWHPADESLGSSLTSFNVPHHFFVTPRTRLLPFGMTHIHIMRSSSAQFLVVALLFCD